MDIVLKLFKPKYDKRFGIVYIPRISKFRRDHAYVDIPTNTVKFCYPRKYSRWPMRYTNNSFTPKFIHRCKTN